MKSCIMWDAKIKCHKHEQHVSTQGAVENLCYFDKRLLQYVNQKICRHFSQWPVVFDIVQKSRKCYNCKSVNSITSTLALYSPKISIRSLNSNQSFQGTGCPVVPLSRDKIFFLYRCFVPGQGQEQMSRGKLLCPGTKLLKIFQQREQTSCFRTSFSVLEHPILSITLNRFGTSYSTLERPILF